MGIRENIRRIVNNNHSTPFSVLGMHCVGAEGEDRIEINAFLPEAKEAWIVDERDSSRYRMENLHRFDFFTAKTRDNAPFPYHIAIARYDGTVQEFRDP